MLEKQKSARNLYIILIFLLFINAFLIWYVINEIPNANLLWMFSGTLILLVANGILTIFTRFEEQMKRAFLIYLGLIAFLLIITSVSVAMGIPNPSLEFYYFLNIISMIVVLVSLVANVVRTENQEKGFHINLHNPKIIPVKFMLPVFFISFLGMFAFVWISKPLIGFPILGAFGNLGIALQSSVLVGIAENIVLIILPYAGIRWAFQIAGIDNPFIAIPIAFIGAIAAFGGYHFFVYSANYLALLIVFFISGFMLALYEGFKTLIIADGMHIGNNAGGVIFSKVQLGIQQIPIMEASVAPIGLLLLIITIGLALRIRNQIIDYKMGDLNVKR